MTDPVFLDIYGNTNQPWQSQTPFTHCFLSNVDADDDNDDDDDDHYDDDDGDDKLTFMQRDV